MSLRENVIEWAARYGVPGERFTIGRLARRLEETFDVVRFDWENRETEKLAKCTLQVRLSYLTRQQDDGGWADDSAYGLIRRARVGVYEVGAWEGPDDLLSATVPDWDYAAYRPVPGTRRRDIGIKRDPKVAGLRLLKHRRQGGVCAGCGRPIGAVVHGCIAHLMALAEGGIDAAENTVVMHHYCNQAMGTGTVGEVRARLRREKAMERFDESAADRALREGMAALQS